MRCFYLPQGDLQKGVSLPLPSELHHHINRVLRLQPGSAFQLFDGVGRVADAVLEDQGRVRITAVQHSPSPRCRLQLIQGIAKGDKLELVLQKGTELGVSHFSLVEMERSIGQLKVDRRGKKIDRWEKIIQEAARQCRQFYLPQLEVGASFKATLAQVDADVKLLLWEDSDVALSSALPQQPVGRVAVVVGPEGGLSHREVMLAQRLGFKSVSLGGRILRTETAGLAIMSILQYLYGDLS